MTEFDGCKDYAPNSLAIQNKLINLTKISKFNSQFFYKIHNLGFSSQGKQISSFEINSVEGPAKFAERRSLSVVVLGGLHAREWITHGTIMCILEEIISSKTVPALLLPRFITFHFIPLINPDGYDVSKLKRYRHWRKNFNIKEEIKLNNISFKKLKCYGVDLNRNFGEENITWGYGNRNAFCSELYQGPKAFSEPESIALKAYIEKIFDSSRFMVVLDVHCCANVILPSSSSSQRNQSLSRYLSNFTGVRHREREQVSSPSNTGVFVDWVDSLGPKVQSLMLELPGKPNHRSFEDLFRNPNSDIPKHMETLCHTLRGIIKFYEPKLVAPQPHSIDPPQQFLQQQLNRVLFLEVLIMFAFVFMVTRRF
eukprot:snap_masked-scaffold_20-processed-gene-5.58-mRNA-1 protein AED:1.00 eAED:1.00 QI:0/-1/0/0/-1/1/1/0/367